MVNVAIAGGSGAVGQTILEIMEEQKVHQPFILSRELNKVEATNSVLYVDYRDIPALIRVLEDNDIHTVISCVGYHGDSLKVAQLNLIQAATASSVTKCFVPSTFAIAYPRSFIDELPTLIDYFAAIEELKKSGLQWTVFLNGCFLDYWAQPHIKSYLKPAPFAIDIANRQAALPGNGNSLITFTYSFDVARFVVAALDLSEWPEESRIAGDALTWNEVVRLAEETLDCKFSVVYDDVETLSTGRITELPCQKPCYERFPKLQFQWFMSMFSRWTMDEKICHIPGELNVQFPKIKCMTVKDMLDTFWKEK
ncbi:hypothetical protein BDV96DRAFT_654602 [Lophiotrema nucula]|uniref:NAD(P)-binding domain-containing protein n=1 Tax=Lophiotrema nucula TaxID=690887 RepID=A0A6A5YI10_9PLEO|nr:hypothetical protein BDV96DRAFT_654602 [Lophiotrema nucula]